MPSAAKVTSRERDEQFRRWWRHAFLLLAIIAWTLLTLAVAKGQDSMTEADRLERQRQIETTKDRIRVLFAEGQYEEVLKAADHLLTLDPENQQGTYWKDRAEEKVRGTPSVIQGVTALPAESGIYRSIRDVPEPVQTPRPTPTPAPLPTPLPASASSSGPAVYGGVGGISKTLIFGLIGGVTVLVLIAAIAWWRLRASRRQLEEALSQVQTQPTGSRLRPGAGILASGADLPTSVGDEVTSHGGRDLQTSAEDENTLSDAPTDFMKALTFGVKGDEITQQQSEQQQAPVSPRTPAKQDVESSHLNLGGGIFGMGEDSQPPPTSGRPSGTQVSGADSQVKDHAETKGDAFEGMVSDGFSPEESKPAVEQSSLKIEGLGSAAFESNPPPAPQKPAAAKPAARPAPSPSAKSAPAPQKQEETKGGVSFNSLMFTGEQTQQPAPDKPTQAEDPDAMSFNSLMFSGEQTAAPKSAPKEEDKDALSFNSLMFSGEQTSMPQKKQDIGIAGEETIGFPSPNDDYQNLMFGQGSDATSGVGAEGTSVGTKADSMFGDIKIEGGLGDGGIDLSMEQTLPIAGPGGTPVEEQEDTIKIDGGGGGSSPSDMFERQKHAGMSALGDGDYAKAVQCLTVAAGLKPGDAEVKRWLDEAKRLRNQ